MRVVLAWLRIELRRRWRSLTVLALLVAIASATVLAAVAGTLRGASAVDRLLAQTLPATVMMQPFAPGFDWDAARALPEVESLATLGIFTQSIEGIADPTVAEISPIGTELMTRVERPIILAGRLADPSRADEAVVTAKFVQSYGFGVGDAVTLRLYSPETVDAANAFAAELPAEPDGPAVRVRIVGVIRTHLLADEPASTGKLVPSAGLYATYPGSILGASGAGFVEAAVRLRDGEADLPAFWAGLERVAGRAKPWIWWLPCAAGWSACPQNQCSRRLPPIRTWWGARPASGVSPVRCGIGGLPQLRPGRRGSAGRAH